MFISWVSLISTLVTFGWDGYLMQKIPQLQRNESGKLTGVYLLRRAITTFLVLYVVCSLIILGIFYYNSNLIVFFDPGQLHLFLLFIFLFATIALIKAFLKIFHVITKVQWIEDVVKPLVLFAAILFYYKYKISLSLTSLYIINLCIFASLAISILFFALKTYKKNFERGSIEPVNEKWIGKCFYFMCIYLGYSIFSRMELLFLGGFEKNEEAAKYQILLRISDLIILPDFLFNYFLPQKFSYAFANNRISDAKNLFRNSAKTILTLQVICLAGVSLIGYLYLQSFNIASTEMYLYLVIMCTAPLFYSLFGSSNLVLKTSGNERFSFYALLIVLILEAAANYIFIVPYGLKAAVIISWSSILVYTLLLSFFLYRKLKFYNRVSGFLFFADRKSKLT